MELAPLIRVAGGNHEGGPSLLLAREDDVPKGGAVESHGDVVLLALGDALQGDGDAALAGGNIVEVQGLGFWRG